MPGGNIHDNDHAITFNIQEVSILFETYQQVGEHKKQAERRLSKVKH
jgi:hypothetical protein